jgi:hypothetical protein
VAPRAGPGRAQREQESKSGADAEAVLKRGI